MPKLWRLRVEYVILLDLRATLLRLLSKECNCATVLSLRWSSRASLGLACSWGSSSPLYLLADNKTKRHFRDRHEVLDDDSEAYCWRRSGFFWRMRASLGLACAQATTLASQVFGKGNPQSRARRTSA